MVSDLLTISTGIKEEFQVLNINTIIERFMAAHEFKKIKAPYGNVEIDMHLEPELLTYPVPICILKKYYASFDQCT